MSEQNRSTELDDRIKALLARAIDDAPQPPDLGGGVMINPQDNGSNRNRWLLGGATGLGIAACIVGLLLINRPDDVAEPMVPATDPTTTTIPGDATESTLAPIVTTTPPVTEPTGTDATDPATTTEPPPASSPATTEPPATTGPATIVTAGADGVHLDGAMITTDPMSNAFAVPDGRVFMQRARVYQPADPAETALLVVLPGSGTPEALAVPPELEAGLVLHDAAAVDGEVVLVVETQPPLCPNPDSCTGAIWAYRPDSGRIDQLQDKNVWEGGWDRLMLATTGLIVGTESESASHWATSFVVPGSGAEPLDLAALGIDETYGDCSDCPNGFGIDPRGGFVSWFENDLETFQTTISIAALDGTIVRIPLIDRPGEAGAGTVCCLDGVGKALPLTPSVVALDPTIDGEWPTGRAILNEEAFEFEDGPERAALPINDVSEGIVYEVEAGVYYDAGTP